jgi:surface antigen
VNKVVIATVVATTMVTGCANMSNEQQGQIAGVAIGTVVAHNASKGHKDRGLALVIGALAGGLIGSQIGASLDERDRQLHGNTTYDALETLPDNTASSWNNPNTGHSGTVVATQTWQTSAGQYCREYQQTIIVGGEQQQGYGTACRQPDGSWKMM